MKFRAALAAMAAVSLAAAPAVAEGDFARVSAPVEGESELAGGGSVVLGIFAAAAFIGGLIIAFSDDENPISA